MTDTPSDTLPVVTGSEAATLWDMGDGVARFSIHTKLNAVTPAVLDVLEDTLERGGSGFRALVLGNDDPRAFSAGGDLAFMQAAIAAGEFSALEAYISRGQRLMLAMKRAPFPVVAAVQGLALGGGWELCVHADAVVAYTGLRAGLPEIKVGLIPAWGGCTQSLRRAQTRPGDDSLRTVFDDLCMATPTASAAEAQARNYLRPRDTVVAEQALLPQEAKRVALEMLPGYEPPAPALIAVEGHVARERLLAGLSTADDGPTETDLSLFEVLAGVLTGGQEVRTPSLLSEEAMMQLELDAISELARRPSSRARIEHMLATGKPLRN